MADTNDNIVTMDYRGVTVEINQEAAKSFKVQKALAQMGSNPQKGFDALDLVFCGKFDELLDTIPDKDGKPYKYGAPTEVVLDLIQQMSDEELLKNE